MDGAVRRLRLLEASQHPLGIMGEMTIIFERSNHFSLSRNNPGAGYDARGSLRELLQQHGVVHHGSFDLRGRWRGHYACSGGGMPVVETGDGGDLALI